MIEVDDSGAIDWSVSVGLLYDAERLSTGAESAGGPTARAAGLESRGNALEADPADGSTVSAIVPRNVRNAISFAFPDVLPWWHAILFLRVIVDLLVWVGLEYRWSNWRLRSPLVKREE